MTSAWLLHTYQVYYWRSTSTACSEPQQPHARPIANNCLYRRVRVSSLLQQRLALSSWRDRWEGTTHLQADRPWQAAKMIQSCEITCLTPSCAEVQTAGSAGRGKHHLLLWQCFVNTGGKNSSPRQNLSHVNICNSCYGSWEEKDENQKTVKAVWKQRNVSESKLKYWNFYCPEFLL